ncbi:hypothetical protein BJ912DRAFT_973830 [Pholiota molesta]|nr:hypothetical protein BJ912DRAFT_973830 [Pholiota molesta]
MISASATMRSFFDPPLLGIGKPLCVVCGVRPAFNNGRRSYQPADLRAPVCNVRPRCERAGKVYPTCGLTCAAKLHARDRQAVEAPRQIIPSNACDNAEVEVPRASDGSDTSHGFSTPIETTVFDEANLEPFECIICLETLERRHLARFACDHTFCRTCLKNHIISELTGHRYPIICPSCKIGKARSDKPVSTVNDVMIQTLGLGEAELAVFYELQLSAHSVAIHCQRCKETIFVDRGDYQQTKIIECPLPRCNYLWCKLCQREVIHAHHLMKQNGWRHCPGCQTPVQKSEGCNHITCAAPGCNTHFCYRSDIREATKQHYLGCPLF